MKLNLTNVVVTVVIAAIAWLFVPSPLHKCPEAESYIVYDTVYTYPEVLDETEPLVQIEDEMVPVQLSEISLYDSLTDIDYSIDLLTLSKESKVSVEPDTLYIIQPVFKHGVIAGYDTLGFNILGETEHIFRSTTFYEIGDTVAQTIHEIAINPRPVEITLFPKPVEFELDLAPAQEEQATPILESPVTWGLLGVIVGGLVVLIIVNNDKDKDNAN